MNEIKLAWEKYLKDSDAEALLRVIEAHTAPLPTEYEYPFLHRIRDVDLNGRVFRVVRLADESEAVFIYPCTTPSLDTPGVPYWLTGESLQKWVRLETELELDEDYMTETPTDWERFR